MHHAAARPARRVSLRVPGPGAAPHRPWTSWIVFRPGVSIARCSSSSASFRKADSSPRCGSARSAIRWWYRTAARHGIPNRARRSSTSTWRASRTTSLRWRDGPRRAAREQAESLDADDWYRLGCDLEPCDVDQALDAYRRALALAPDHADVHMNLGRLLHEAGRLEEAEAHYRQALDARPGGRDRRVQPRRGARGLAAAARRGAGLRAGDRRGSRSPGRALQPRAPLGTTRPTAPRPAPLAGLSQARQLRVRHYALAAAFQAL